MAKSKNGGTRAYIRGRIGSDVYSIGKDGKGSRQQVVRSLAEQVSNPRSQSQMFGRMVMSTVMQAVSALSYIIDHSFDGMAKGQPSISEFIRRNYQLVKEDATNFPVSGNKFGLNAYQEKGAKNGAYVISDGKAFIPAAAVLTAAQGAVAITATGSSLTVDALRSALSFGNEDYLTIVGINDEGSADFARLSINPNAQGSVVITSENITEVLLVDGNVTPAFTVAGMAITATIASIAGNCGIIVTKKENGGFIHSSCTLSAPVNPLWNATTALISYPVGTQMYLNGGNINGGGGSEVLSTAQFATAQSASAPLPVTIKNVIQEEGAVILIGEDDKRYLLQNGNDDTTRFGQYLTELGAEARPWGWANDEPEVANDGTVYILNYTDSTDEGYALANEGVSYLIAHGASWNQFFVS